MRRWYGRETAAGPTERRYGRGGGGEDILVSGVGGEGTVERTVIEEIRYVKYRLAIWGKNIASGNFREVVSSVMICASPGVLVSELLGYFDRAKKNDFLYIFVPYRSFFKRILKSSVTIISTSPFTATGIPSPCRSRVQKCYST